MSHFLHQKSDILPIEIKNIRAEAQKEVNMSILKLDANHFEASVSQGKVVVDFWADWCDPCRMLAPVIEEIAKERTDITVGKLNISDHPDIAAQFGVVSIPTLIFFKDGEEQKRIVGARPKKVILAELESFSQQKRRR